MFAAGCINNLLHLASNMPEHNIKISLQKKKRIFLAQYKVL